MSDIIMRGTKVYKEWQSLVNELEAENAALLKSTTERHEELEVHIMELQAENAAMRYRAKELENILDCISDMEGREGMTDSAFVRNALKLIAHGAPKIEE